VAGIYVVVEEGKEGGGWVRSLVRRGEEVSKISGHYYSLLDNQLMEGKGKILLLPSRDGSSTTTTTMTTSTATTTPPSFHAQGSRSGVGGSSGSSRPSRRMRLRWRPGGELRLEYRQEESSGVEVEQTWKEEEEEEEEGHGGRRRSSLLSPISSGVEGWMEGLLREGRRRYYASGE